MKLIELTEDHYIVVDDSVVEDGNIAIIPGYTRYVIVGDMVDILYSEEPHRCWQGLYCDTCFDIEAVSKFKKVIGSTAINGDSKVKYIPLPEVNELIGKVDIDELAEKYAKAHSIYESGQDDVAYGFREGYNQCLENNRDKKYTEEDMIKFINWVETSQEASDYYRKNRMRFDIKMDGNSEIEKRLPELLNLYIQSHQPIKEWEVEFDQNNKLKLKK